MGLPPIVRLKNTLVAAVVAVGRGIGSSARIRKIVAMPAFIPVNIDQNTLLAIVPDKNIVKMLSRPFGQQGGFDIWGAGIFIELNKIRMLHFRTVVLATAGSDGGINGGGAVILPFPLLRISAELRKTVSISSGSAPVRKAIREHNARSASEWEP